MNRIFSSTSSGGVDGWRRVTVVATAVILWLTCQPVGESVAAVPQRSAEQAMDISDAPVIVEGVALGHRAVRRVAGIRTITRFDVDEVIKGEEVADVIEVVTLGGELASGLEMYVEHQPQLVRGERSRLYLRPAGERYRVVGDDQGHHVLEQNDGGAEATATCPDGGIAGDGYCLIGASWVEGSMAIPFYVNPNSTDLSSEEYAIREAFNDWESDPYSDVRFDYRGRTSAAINARDDAINVFFADTPSNFLARTTYWAKDGRMLHFDIEINDRYAWSYGVAPDRYDLTSTMRHEVGHALGLGHVADPDDLMYCCFSQGSEKRISEANLRGIRAIYPADPPDDTPPSDGEVPPDPEPQPDPGPAPATVVDDPSFWGPSHYIARFTGLGWDGDMYRTWAEGDGYSAVNGAAWVGDISGGRYRVEVYIPRDHAVATVKYYVRHNGGQSVVAVDQSRYFDQWVSLGVYDINGPRASVGSNDASGQRASEIGWDAARWLLTDEPINHPDPAPGPQPETTLVDDPSFWGPSQYISSFAGVGWDGDMYRTWTEGEGYAAVNGAEWVGDITGGRYRIEVFIPRAHAVATVKYYVRHNGGQSVVSIDQSRYFDQWVSLGVYDINGPRASVGSNDATGVRAQEIGWDAIRWVRV